MSSFLLHVIHDIRRISHIILQEPLKGLPNWSLYRDLMRSSSGTLCFCIEAVQAAVCTCVFDFDLAFGAWSMAWEILRASGVALRITSPDGNVGIVGAWLMTISEWEIHKKLCNNNCWEAILVCLYFLKIWSWKVWHNEYKFHVNS